MWKSEDETIIRQRAVNLYHSGIKVPDICLQLNRTRVWFYKWLRRRQSGQPVWYEDVSKAPNKIANKTPTEVVELVLEIRNALEETRGSLIGAKTIQSRLVILGWGTVSIRTINRILKKHRTTRNHAKQIRKKQRKKRKPENNPQQLALF